MPEDYKDTLKITDNTGENIMTVITTMKQLKENIATFDSYLWQGTPEEKD